MNTRRAEPMRACGICERPFNDENVFRMSTVARVHYWDTDKNSRRKVCLIVKPMSVGGDRKGVVCTDCTAEALRGISVKLRYPGGVPPGQA